MWGMYQWATEIEEHVPYRLDLGRFWYWLEYNLDLGNKNSQAIMEPRLYAGMAGPTIRPHWGAVEFEDEWDFPWMNHRASLPASDQLSRERSPASMGRHRAEEEHASPRKAHDRHATAN
jgi:hypothetical protein